MKKKVLFIIGNLGEGGVSKSIVNLLNIIDRGRYDISLLVCSTSRGLLDPLLPDDITVIKNETIGDLLDGFPGVKHLITEGRAIEAVGSLLRMVLSRIDKSLAGRLLARLMPPIEGSWDIIVDYNGQHQCYYMVNKLHSSRKYTFFHSDYAKWSYYFKADRHYFQQVDGIFTISETCADSLRKFFPEQSDKIAVMPNLSSPTIIRKMAEETAHEMEGDFVKFITVAHLTKNKGTDIALYAAKLLKEKGVRFKWYFIGKDSHDLDYPALVNELGIDDNIVFLGLRVNPYAYVSKADIFVLPSLFEGKSIALDEAKILGKPVVVTNFSTVHDQFEDQVNATICDMTPQSVADAIYELIEYPQLRERYISSLQSSEHGNAAEIERFYHLFDNN